MTLSWWHLLVGFLFANGMAHYLMGVAGKRFRSPLGANSAPVVNVVWGLTNFVVATGLIVWRGADPAWTALLVGFWLGVAMFGVAMGYFKGEGF